MKKIGILAVQGAFIEHEQVLSKLGCQCVELRKKSDICSLDGLVLPGGESTVQGKLICELGMFQPLKEIINTNTPVLATCAGLILLAKNIINEPNVYFGTMPITIKRNAYGRQLGSFTCASKFADFENVNMTFIRAPYIEKIDCGVSILATVNQNIVAAKYRNQIGMAFHPELGNDVRIHKYFLDEITRS